MNLWDAALAGLVLALIGAHFRAWHRRRKRWKALNLPKGDGQPGMYRRKTDGGSFTPHTWSRQGPSLLPSRRSAAPGERPPHAP